MSSDWLVWLYFSMAFVAANLPWFSERVFFVLEPRGGEKGPAMRLFELLVLYFIVGGIGLGFERQVTGSIHGQGWQFYAITGSLFLVFALPGFIYRYDLRRHLRHR
jgi:hypothetical protein